MSQDKSKKELFKKLTEESLNTFERLFKDKIQYELYQSYSEGQMDTNKRNQEQLDEANKKVQDLKEEIKLKEELYKKINPQKMDPIMYITIGYFVGLSIGFLVWGLG